tara:strand:- start:44688 stop:44981 length:294 start_codon:yes stop_codon:yes gene_type:complete
MGRLLLTYILPLIFPLLVYLAWNAYARSKAKRSGGVPPSLERGPIFWAIVAGFILLVTSLLTLAVLGGDSPDSGQYVGPRYEDGKIIPPTFIPDPNK